MFKAPDLHKVETIRPCVSAVRTIQNMPFGVRPFSKGLPILPRIKARKGGLSASTFDEIFQVMAEALVKFTDYAVLQPAP
jgi:hypothetical protein